MTASRILALSLALALPSAPALAWKAYHLEGNLWAIRCNDGTLWSYSGSQGGLGTVGPALCADHGGLIGGGEGPEIEPAPTTIRQAVGQGCPTLRQETGGQASGRRQPIIVTESEATGLASGGRQPIGVNEPGVGRCAPSR